MTLSANAYITAATPNTFVAHSQQHNVMKLSQDVCSNSPIIPVPRPSSQHTHTRVSI